MNVCLLCGKNNSMVLSLSFIFSFKKLRKSLICKGCLHKFQRIDFEQACLGCSRPQKNQSFCSDCQKWKQEYSDLTLNHKALFTYNKIARDYMKEFKFQGDLILAELFAEEIANILQDYQKTHYIVPIPISNKSMENRGFSQVNLMLEKSGICYKDWLVHTGKGERQSTKNRKDRLQSKQFLAVNLENIEAKKMNKSILIVDDVYTTGRTIMHAKNVFSTLEILNENEGSRKEVEVDSFSLFR